MARQVKRKMGWDERSDNEIAHKTGLSGFIHNISGLDQSVQKAGPSMTYRCEGLRARLDFASAKGTEAMLRRARMLQ
jgi:hypothetical protein